MKLQDPIQKLIPGSCYHIYNRGNNKEVIFKSHENYIYFLTQWKKYIQPVADTFGSLFQERFKRKEVLNDYYFSEIVGYILTNAKKHGYSKNILEYPYSAYKSLISTSNTLLLRDEVISFFGGKVPFMKFVENYAENILLKKFLFENEMDDE